jgi:hypothetical protein
MGAEHSHLMTQLQIGPKVQMRVADLERVPYGYRSAVGCQVGRLVHKAEGAEYGSPVHVFLKSIRYVPASPERFQSHFEKRCPGFLKLIEIRSPENTMYFDCYEARECK